MVDWWRSDDLTMRGFVAAGLMISVEMTRERPGDDGRASKKPPVVVCPNLHSHPQSISDISLFIRSLNSVAFSAHDLNTVSPS
jgi:hypothetical protein